MDVTIRQARYTPLPLNELHPHGWYKNQLDIQAEGLSGHLDEFWPDIKDSKWVGGKAEGWERLPYWLDGFIPLAVLQRNKKMMARAKKFIDAILERQELDGWLCPTNTLQERATYDVWALFLILKVFTIWADATDDPRIESAIYRALRALDSHIDKHTLFNWAAMRWFECLIPIFWLHQRRKEQWLEKLCVKIQAQGFDWMRFFKHWPMSQPNERGHWSLLNHVVNNAMMLKSPALIHRISGNQSDLEFSHFMINSLDQAHGMITGVFTGDECLAGLNPSHGTELCSVAEYMYSIQFLLGESGDPSFADRLERIAYNAWPATFDKDMWLHQYDQQVNQMKAVCQKDPIWLTNRPDANTFGLEPDFGCCTANFSQGWPKLSQSVFYRDNEGFLLGAYLPLVARTSWEGKNITLELNTDYPFRDQVILRVKASSPVMFSIKVRVPNFAQHAKIEVDNELQTCVAGEYITLNRMWNDNEIKMHFPMRASYVARPNQQYALIRGPLVYSLKIEENWVRINEHVPGHELPHGDFEIYPASPWNMKLVGKPDASDIVFSEFPISNTPFCSSTAPVVANTRGFEVDWAIEHDSAAAKAGNDRLSDTKQVTLIPYGCTCLRMTEMPIQFEEA